MVAADEWRWKLRGLRMFKSCETARACYRLQAEMASSCLKVRVRMLNVESLFFDGRKRRGIRGIYRVATVAIYGVPRAAPIVCKGLSGSNHGVKRDGALSAFLCCIIAGVADMELNF